MKQINGTTDEPLAPIADGIAKVEKKVAEAWGRKAEATALSAALSLVLVIVCPFVVFLNHATLYYFDGAVTSALSSLFQLGPVKFFSEYGASPSISAAQIYLGWLIFQGVLYQILPGPMSKGQVTPAGNLLDYRTNGLRAWILTHILFLTLGYLEIIDLAVIAKHWPGLLIAATVYGLSLPVFAQVKAHYAPTHPDDRKFSGSFIFDYFVGIELNPRFGQLWDFKLFHNGRPGIIAWTLISISHTAYQYQKLGRVTNSMWLVDLFHFIYVLDFFWNESWYLRTIDMAHDHFGYYLGFGSVVIVPSLYTIQAQYLARYPVDLPTAQVVGILVIGLGGYIIFRGANYQKDIVRSTGGKCPIWGKPAEFIRAQYVTGDGQDHESLLLTSGKPSFHIQLHHPIFPPKRPIIMC